MSKLQPAFVQDGALLVGQTAYDAFNAQSCRCNCGRYHDGRTIGGTCGDMPAMWHECSSCGTALGRPIVYLAQSQINAKRDEMSRFGGLVLSPEEFPMITANTRIRDIAEQNRVKTVTKLDNGDLRVEQRSGNVFTIAKDDELFQAFLVYTVLADL